MSNPVICTDNTTNTAMAKNATVQLRVSVDHKESMRAWADRLGLTLTQLYMVLTCQAGSADLNRLILTEFSLKQLQRLGLPDSAPVILQNHEEGMKRLTVLMAVAARLELAEAVGDYTTAEFMRTQVEQAESELLRTYGAAVDAFAAPVVQGEHVTDNE